MYVLQQAVWIFQFDLVHMIKEINKMGSLYFTSLVLFTFLYIVQIR